LLSHVREAQNRSPLLSDMLYCEVEFTSHDAGGLTERDLRAARLLDQLLEAPDSGQKKG